MKIQNGISLQQPDPETKAKQLDGQLRDAAKMYEGYFLNQMVKAMRSTVNREDGVVKQNFAEKIFTEQLDGQYVDAWSNKGGVGLADMIYNQISEKYQAATQKKDFLHGKGALPVAPKKDIHGVPAADSIQFKTIPPGPEAKLEYRFEIQQPSGAEYEVQAPLPGKVLESKTLGEGWSLVRMDHGQGVTSEMTFPGRATESGSGADVQPGQRLGVLDPGRPVLAWKLDWV